MDGRSIGRITAAELGRMIGRGELSPTEAVNSYLERVDRLDGQLGGMTLVGREEALGEAAPGDLVVIAGKGHESVQEVGESVIEFDDRQVAQSVLLSMGFDGRKSGELDAQWKKSL